MSITNELREFAPHLNIGKVALAGWKEALLAIADRIDAEYQKAKDEWVAKGGQSWLHGYEECRLELVEGNEVIAASLEEAGWVKLPLDADGKVIHVGDMMDTEHFGTVEVEGFVHNAVAFYNYSGQPAYICTSPANLCRHHYEPTLEDVLAEFALEIDPSADIAVTGAETIKKFAAKLQLRDDAE